MSDLPERFVDGTRVTHAVNGGNAFGLVSFCREYFSRADLDVPLAYCVIRTLPNDSAITCVTCLVEGASIAKRVRGYDGFVHLTQLASKIDLITQDFAETASYWYAGADVIRRRPGASDEIRLRCARWAPDPSDTKPTDLITCPRCLEEL